MFKKMICLELLLIGLISIEIGMPRTPEWGQSQPEKLPLVITVGNPTAAYRKAMPVSGYIELVASIFFAHDNFCLKTPEEQPVPVQAEVLETWPDGSARLVQLDFWDDFGPEQVRVYTLNRDRKTAGKSDADWITEIEQGVRVNTGKIEFRITSENILENIHFDANSNGNYESSELAVAHGDFFLRQNGRDFQSSFSNGKVEILEKGALKCRVAVSGFLANANQQSIAEYRLEIEAFRNQPYLYVSPWFKMLSGKSRVLKVHLSLFTPDRLKACHFGEAPELQNVPVQHWVRLIQERPGFYKVTNQDGTFADGETGPGWVDILNGGNNFTIYQQNFESQKGFLLRKNEVLVYLWPPHAGFISPKRLVQFESTLETVKSPHQILLYFHSTEPPRQIVQSIGTLEGQIPQFKVSPVISEMR